MLQNFFYFITINSSAKRYKHFYIHVRKLFKITRSSSANVTILCLLVINSSAHVTKDFLMSQWATVPMVQTFITLQWTAVPMLRNFFLVAAVPMLWAFSYIVMNSQCCKPISYLAINRSANVTKLFPGSCSANVMSLFLHWKEQQCSCYKTFFLFRNGQRCQWYKHLLHCNEKQC
jgi:hypothetical protein